MKRYRSHLGLRGFDAIDSNGFSGDLAFLHGSLDVIVYSQQPSGFIDPRYPNHVCRLHKFLYGLKQAPRTWFQRFATYARSVGFIESKFDTSLFILHKEHTTAYLLLYADDIILTASSPSTLTSIITSFANELL